MAKQTEIIEKVEIFDDLDGKPLSPDTESKRYQLNGKTYDLYLSAANTATVDAFIADLVDGAEEITARKNSATTLGEIDKAARESMKAAYAKAHDLDADLIRFSKRVEEWYAQRGSS